MRISIKKLPKEPYFPQLWEIALDKEVIGNIQSQPSFGTDLVFYYLSSQRYSIPRINTYDRALTLAEAKREVREYIKKHIRN